MATRNSTTKKPLTDKFVKALSSREIVYRKRDSLVKGFHVAVSPDGNKGWALQFTSPEVQATRKDGTLKFKPDGSPEMARPFYPLGKFPTTSVAVARKKALALRELVDKGVDPKEEDKRQQDAERAEAEGTFGNLLNLYVSKLEDEGAASAKDIKKVLDRVVDERTRLRPADPAKTGGITEADILRMMRGVKLNAALRGNPGDRSADLFCDYIRAAYEFAMKARSMEKWADQAKPFKDLLMNPARHITRSQTNANIGERTLESDEVKFLWNKAGVEALSLDLALYIKLSLALGGQRVLELLHSEWKEFDTDDMTWSIPMARRKIRYKAKHREPHLVPLTQFSIDLLDQLRPLSGNSKYLFPDRTGKKPRTPDALNQAIKRFCNPEGKSKREPFNKFSGRDLRRTWKTLAGRAGLSKEIRDRLQGHAFGDVASRHYDRHDYLKEKRAAMGKWCRWLDELVIGKKKTKVVQLKKA